MVRFTKIKVINKIILGYKKEMEKRERKQLSLIKKNKKKNMKELIKIQKYFLKYYKNYEYENWHFFLYRRP